jgi:anti-sigma B factor antagonist
MSTERFREMSDSSLITIQALSQATVLATGPRAQLIEEPILEPLTRELLAAAAAAQPPVVVIDLSQTTFFGSGFLETLFRVAKTVQSQPQGKLALCGLHPYCREVLEITHLDSLWPIYATRDEALAALS